MFLFGIVIVAIVIAVLYFNRSQDEELLVLKLIGYYILGVFYISINGLVLPVGFVISLFLRPSENRGIKRGASIIGLILMLIGRMLG